MSGFIVIEGLDGMGKSTLVNKLAEEFACHAMSTPGPALSNSLTQPDLTILLHLDETERQRRLQTRGATLEDMETLDPNFHECVLDEFHVRANLVVDITGLAWLDAVSNSITEYLDLNKIEAKESLVF